MNSDESVSVIIPTYNRKNYVGETLKSVSFQRYKNIEVLLADDGATDGTKEYVLSIFGNDLRLRYLHQENRGAAAARNRGIRNSKGI